MLLVKSRHTEISMLCAEEIACIIDYLCFVVFLYFKVCFRTTFIKNE